MAARAPSLNASWAVTSAQAVISGARTWTGVASRTVNLLREGSDYGKHNLNQLDMKLAKRFTLDKVRLRVDFDLYNVFNSSWPYTVTTTYSTAPPAPGSARPTCCSIASSSWARTFRSRRSEFAEVRGL